jgi:hypothetical protein
MTATMTAATKTVIGDPGAAVAAGSPAGLGDGGSRPSMIEFSAGAPGTGGRARP